jgi:hypothetical protein
MAKRKRNAVSEVEAPGISVQDKIARCLALIATKGVDTDAAALKLDAAGFSAAEIGALLDVGTNYVNVARHRRRTGGKKTRAG